MDRKSKIDFIAVMAGIVLLGVGLYLIKTIVEPKGFMRAFPYVCIGLGSGLFVFGK